MTTCRRQAVHDYRKCKADWEGFDWEIRIAAYAYSDWPYRAQVGSEPIATVLHCKLPRRVKNNTA